MRARAPDRRLVEYRKRDYPTMVTIGRFGKWSLSKLRRKVFGIGGSSLLLIVGFCVAGALVESLRWHLVGIATALLLLAGGLLALFYARFMLNRVINDQHRSIRDSRTQLQASLDRLTKEISDSKDTLARMNVGNFPLFQQLNRR